MTATGRGRRGLVVGVAAALVGVALVAVVVSWSVAAHADLRRAQSRLGRAEGALARTRAAVSAARGALAAQTRQRDDLDAQVRADHAAVGTTTQKLQAETSSVQQRSVDVSSLRACLNGIDGAYRDLAAKTLPDAVGALDTALGPCIQSEGGDGSGLAYPYDFPDPFVLLVGHTYYAYATNSAAGNIQIITSTDLVHWSPVGDALPHLATWAGTGDTWAPSVLHLGDHYVMYYAAEFGASGKECLSAAVATDPAGPFVDSSAFPLVCQLALGGSIDPSVFIDPGGGLYLDWRSEGTDRVPPTIWGQRLDGAGTGLVGSAAVLLRPSQSWEDGIVEAPDMFWLGGHRWLFYSGALWKTPHYAIGLAECAGPQGPCTKTLDGPVFTSQGVIVGPGGPAMFWSSSGVPEVAFAAWLPGEVGFPNSRVLFIRPLTTAGGVPAVCPAPPSAGAGAAGRSPPPAGCPATA